MTGVQPHDDDGRLLCLECGRPFSLLAPHLARAHQMSSPAYREAHQLPRTLSLRAADLSERARQQGRERYAQREDIRATMEAGRRNAVDVGGPASSQATAMRPMVRAARRRGGEGKRDSARRRIDGRAQAAGFADIGAYLDGRRGVSVASMARELRVSRSTVSAWQQRTAAARAV